MVKNSESDVVITEYAQGQQSPAWRRARATTLLHEAHDAIEKAMRVLGHEGDGCRLGAARQAVVDVMEDLRNG